jgi:hypothetical protein
MPASVRSEHTSLSNCANAASTPSISLPVDVSSIGSVADRSEMPSEFRCARSAKWSYFSRANHVRLDDHVVDLTLVRAAVLQQRLELAAIRSLGAPALFVEAFENVDLIRRSSSVFNSVSEAVMMSGTPVFIGTRVPFETSID